MTGEPLFDPTANIPINLKKFDADQQQSNDKLIISEVDDDLSALGRDKSILDHS